MSSDGMPPLDEMVNDDFEYQQEEGFEYHGPLSADHIIVSLDSFSSEYIDDFVVDTPIYEVLCVSYNSAKQPELDRLDSELVPAMSHVIANNPAAKYMFCYRSVSRNDSIEGRLHHLFEGHISMGCFNVPFENDVAKYVLANIP